MAEAVNKALGLNNPAQHHGATANDHAEAHYDLANDRSDEETLGPASRHGELEKYLEPIRTTSHQLERTYSGVDVEKAQEAFADLGRELSAHSWRMSRQNSKARAKRQPRAAVPDVEKANSSSDSSEEPWDLETYLRGAKTADIEAGIKSKLIGMSRTAPIPRCAPLT
jgi:ATP-binding cassette, subfamily G (WHITE), member 2, SNQ2